MCVCVHVSGVGIRSVASHIEIDGQDYGEKGDGSKDEDEDTILDDPADRERGREKERWISLGSQNVHQWRKVYKHENTEISCAYEQVATHKEMLKHIQAVKLYLNN